MSPTWIQRARAHPIGYELPPDDILARRWLPTIAAYVLRGGLFAATLAVFASCLSAADALDKNAFLSRQKWYVTFTFALKGNGEATRSDGTDHWTTRWNIHREVTGMFELDHPGQYGPRNSVLAPGERYQGRYVNWDGRGLSSVDYVVADHVEHESVTHGEAGAETNVSGYTKFSGTGKTQIGSSKELKCDLKDMTFDFLIDGLAGWNREPGVKPLNLSGEYHSETPITRVRDDIVFPVEAYGIFAMLPEVGPLKAQLLSRKLELVKDGIGIHVSMPVETLPVIPPHSGSIPGGSEKFNRWTTAGGPPLELSLDVHLTPGPPSRAQLILKPHDYDAWRPKCSKSEEKPGNQFQVDWRVEEDDHPGQPTEVTRVIFSLLNTSREPGVCMNYPLRPKTPADFDLKFERKGTQAGYFVATDGQKLTLSDRQVSARKGTVAVDCFDAGAWSDLSVTAELADGRTLIGYLEANPSVVRIPLPKRTGNSHIADAWKTEHGVTAADNDDSEKSPSPRKPPGDGFTLYEEYRGFFVDGGYIEGNPQRIDFFVRNFIGEAARPAIGQFAGLTNAIVHDQLRDDEFDPANRVLNGNHQRGAHNKDQHGVFLRTEEGVNGAQARFTTAAVRGRPGLCTGIFVQPRGAHTSTSTSENVPASDLVSIYDQFIVHELLHTVGVEHHGEGDYYMSPWLIFSDNPVNNTGKPYFEVHGARVTITDERTGRDLAAKLEPDLLLARERFRPLVARFMDKNKPEEFEIALNLFLGIYHYYVGAQQGECSGEEGCAMRYYFAKLYEKKGVANAYYYIGDKHTERAGLALCHSITGSGINLATRKPQSRYGNAISGWGDCADWIVFNDAARLEAAPKKPSSTRK